MKHKYEFLCTWVGYDVFAVDPNGGRYQIGFQLPHFDAFTRAWRAHGLPAPLGIGWLHIGGAEYVCEVWQSAYGHPARKRTWLFYKGPKPPQLRWDREPGKYQVGWFDRIKPTLGKAAAMATPPEFRDELLTLARHAKV